jgi:hypothetical protein
VRVSNRSLTLVVALTGADFLLWNLALGANNAALAVVAGLTLPPLVAACVLALVLGAARLLSRVRTPAISPISRRSAGRRRPRTTRPAQRHAPTQPSTPALRTARARGAHTTPTHDGLPATAASGRSPTPARELAA